MYYDKVTPLRKFLRGFKRLLMGCDVYEIKFGTDVLVIWTGKVISAATQQWRVSRGNLYDWEELWIEDARYLRLWLARSNMPIGHDGPKEGKEHCLELTFRLN